MICRLATVCLIGAASATNAATFDIVFYDSAKVGISGNTRGDIPSRNINTSPVVTSGTFEVADDAIAPGAAIDVQSSDFLGLDVSWTDSFGVELNWTLPGDPIRRSTDRSFVALFDDAGDFLRFDTVGLSTAIPGFLIFDDEIVDGVRNPALDFEDRDGFDLGYLLEPATSITGGRDYRAGDFFSIGTQGAIGDFVRIAGTYSMDSSMVGNPSEANGVYVVSERVVGNPSPMPPSPMPPSSMPPSPTPPSPIPLPASGWLLIAGFAGLGSLSRRRR